VSSTKKIPALIVHEDNIWGEIDLKIEGGFIKGTLDDLLGMLLCISDIHLLKEYKIPIFFTKNEEIDLGGSKKLAAHWDKKYLPIAVDVTLAKDCDCSLENFYKFSQSEILKIKESVENHEDFICKTKKFTGEIDDCDDSWSFISKKIKCFTFGIPVTNHYHTKDCKISISQFERTAKCLTWVLSALL
jgi:hypothetical protein